MRSSVLPAITIVVVVAVIVVGAIATATTMGSGTLQATQVSSSSVSNTGAPVLQNPPPFPSADYLGPAWTAGGNHCVVSSNGAFSGAPCYVDNVDNATVFDCADSANTTSGCTTTVVSPSNTQYNYNITIWYPRLNSSDPETNCAFLPAVGYTQPLYAWCITVGQNSFIIANQVQTQPEGTAQG